MINNHYVKWVDFGERDMLVKCIQTFLLGDESEQLLYIVGKSDIGKTHTVYRACQESSLQSVIYYQSYESFQQEDYLYSGSLNLTAIIVIDDVQMEDYVRLESAIGKFGKHIKIIAIGPSTKNNVEGYRGIIEVSEPKNADVEKVIKAKLSTADSVDITRLAALCDNDLRLALLICDMWRSDPSLINSFNRLNQIWTRILELSSNSIGDPNRFKEDYEILALCLDVGNMGTHVNELKFLASYFGKEVTDLNRAIKQATNSSLGKQQGRFFEPSPAALARWIFESASWPLVKNNAVEFLDQMPSERI